MKPLKLAVAGCGQISRAYGNSIRKHPEALEIVGAFDLDSSRAADFCKEYGGDVYPDFETLLADDKVDVVLNLTIHHAHFELNARALRAGKHVYTEKPMALTHAQASELVGLAKEMGCRLGCAPTTYLGAGVQTAARFLQGENNGLGPLRLVYAEVNYGQIERWIGSPAAYFSVGPLLDVGVYAITAMTFLLGRVQQVWGYSATLKNPRFDQSGVPFPVTAPDFTVGMLEFESGVIARLTTNYYVHSYLQQPYLRGMEFHGDDGAYLLSQYHDMNGTGRYICHRTGEEKPVPILRESECMDRALGLVEMADAIRENRPHRGSAEHGAHVVEIMEALQRSFETSQRVEITSKLDRIEVLDWAKDIPLQFSSDS